MALKILNALLAHQAHFHQYLEALSVPRAHQVLIPRNRVLQVALFAPLELTMMQQGQHNVRHVYQEQFHQYLVA